MPPQRPLISDYENWLRDSNVTLSVRKNGNFGFYKLKYTQSERNSHLDNNLQHLRILGSFEGFDRLIQIISFRYELKRID